MKILFLHGLESKPGGTKALALKEAGYEVLNPALPKEPFDIACKIAQDVIYTEKPGVIVGSSRGGAVAMNVDSLGAKRVLIAPAWKKFGISSVVPKSTVILHSPQDDIVDYEDSVSLAKECGANLITIGTDHRMSSSEVLNKIVEVVSV